MPNDYPLTEREMERRREACRHAKASVSLEGFTVSAEYEAQERLYIEGKLTINDLIERAKRRAGCVEAAA